MRARGFKGIFVWTAGLTVLVASLTGQTTTTVYGTDTYPADHLAVQTAVDAFDTVILEGTFDFGPDGGIWITRPGFTLMGSPGGVLIKGGGAPSLDVRSTIFASDSAVSTPSNLTIKDLTIDGAVDFAIFVSLVSQGPTAVTTITGNTITNTWRQAIHWCESGGSADIAGNVIDTVTYGIYTHDTGTGAPEEFVNVSGNTVTARAPVTSLRHNCFRTIAENVLTATMGWGIGVQCGEWNVDRYVQLDPADIPATLIQNNAINMSNAFNSAIWMGDYYYGGINCTVKGNVIFGLAVVGLNIGPWGGWNNVTGNDLSGLTTVDAQVWEAARYDVFSGNTFGQLDNWITVIDIYAYGHPVTLPEPTAHNTFMDNDYRMTGVPGWDEGAGVFLLGYDWWGGGAVLNEVRDNLVFESGRFPRGEGGASFQVLDLGVNNRIIGMPASGLTDPGIGREIKEARMRIMESLMVEGTALEKKK